MDKNTLKSWFQRGDKPTEAQFAAWMDSYWHKDEQLPVASIDELAETLAQKLDIGNIPEYVNAAMTLFLPIHTLVNSANITESLRITGVALNRNCSRIFLVDKTDIENTLEIELQAQEEGTEPVDIDLSQFTGKPVFIFCAETTAGKGIDVSLQLKSNQ